MSWNFTLKNHDAVIEVCKNRREFYLKHQPTVLIFSFKVIVFIQRQRVGGLSSI
jgi:hypothetical protein